MCGGGGGGGVLKPVLHAQNPPLILMQFQITSICSVRIVVFYLISETSQGNTYKKLCDETKQRAQ